MIPRSLRSLVVMLAATLGLVAGCGKAEPWKVVHKASGKVLWKGQPIQGAQLFLYPRQENFPESVRPTAITDAEGKFQVGTYGKDDGAPAGDYGVAIIWHPLVDAGSGPTRGDNKLPVKLSKPETSNLTVHIDAPETQIPTLDLKP